MGILTTVGFIVFLGVILGILIYFLRQALDSNDSKRIDQDKDHDHFSQ
jgi:capsular polysaccharide biosynthesis protein